MMDETCQYDDDFFFLLQYFWFCVVLALMETQLLLQRGKKSLNVQFVRLNTIKSTIWAPVAS